MMMSICMITTCLERTKTFHPSLKFSQAQLKSKHLLLNVLPHLVMIRMMLLVMMIITMTMAITNLLLLLDHSLHLLFTSLSGSDVTIIS